MDFNGEIYSKFSDVPAELISGGYADDEYAEHFFNKCKWGEGSLHQEDDIGKLTLLINLFSKKKKFHVLDYGGGVGQLFFMVEKYLTSPELVVWNVLDIPGIINVAKEKIKSITGLHLYGDIASIKNSDLLYFRQSFQVLDDYKEILTHITRTFHPKIIYISGVTAGENKDYVTLLLLKGEKGVPCRIYNEEKLLRFVNSLGYDLIDRFSENERKRVDLSNFSEEFQLDGKRNNLVKGYIFMRNDDGNIGFGTE